MKKILDILSIVVRKFSLMYTILVTVAAVASICVNQYDEPAIMSSLVLYILLFSFLSSLVIVLCDLIKSNAILKNALKFLLVYASFAVSFFVKAGTYSSNKLFTVSMLSLMFVVLYLAVAAVMAIVTAVKKRIQNKNTEYISVFNK